jgi:hypothetical protein
MANKEHLALLKQGVDAWNDGRQQNAEIQPDLSEEDFSNLELCGMDFSDIAFLHQVRYIFRAETLTGQGLVVPHQSRKCYKLRECNYLPILFDFDKPDNRNITETVSTVAHLARFIITDLTDPQAIPQELQNIVSALPSVPVQSILQISTDEDTGKPKNEWGMFWDLMEYPSVLNIYDYKSLEELIISIEEHVIVPAEAKVQELLEKRLRIQEEKFRTRQNRERGKNEERKLSDK